MMPVAAADGSCAVWVILFVSLVRVEAQPGFSFGGATPVVTTQGTSEHGVTVQLSLQLSASEANIYTIYAVNEGDSLATQPMRFPASYQSATGGDIGATAVITPEDVYDSFLTVGLGEVTSFGGIDTSTWSTEELVVIDGSVLYPDPTIGPSGTVLIAQLTVPCNGEYTALVNAQGQTVDGSDDWQQTNIEFQWATSCPSGCLGDTTGTCLNGGTCVDEVDSFLCNCLEDYDGLICENWIEPTFSTGSATPIVSEISTVNLESGEAFTTFQLFLSLSSAEANVHSLYAFPDSPAMTFPAAFQTALGGDIGVTPVIAEFDAYDSYLTSKIHRT